MPVVVRRTCIYLHVVAQIYFELVVEHQMKIAGQY